MGGHGNGSAIEYGPKVIALNRKPGNGIAEAGRDRSVVFRGTNYPSRCRCQQCFERGDGCWQPFGCLGPWSEQWQVERCEIEKFALLAKVACARLEALGQLEVFTITGSDD